MLSTTSPSGTALRLDFDPARDGFGFVNLFAWTPPDLDFLADQLRLVATGTSVALPTAAAALAGGPVAGLALGGVLAGGGFGKALVRGVAQRWATFGLCGGMAQAAIDRWPNRGGLPTADLERDALRALLRRRQADTLRASLGRFLKHWVAFKTRPDYSPHPPLEAELRHELARIRASLEAGRPALLGLVGDAPDPFGNHQVACFGLEDAGDGDRLDVTLQVYDPNSPGRTLHIRAQNPQPGRIALTTDLRTGWRNGRALVSTEPGTIGFLFVIEPSR